VRFRLRGFSTYLTGTPWSEDFMRAYAAALDGVKAQHTEIEAGRTKPGSFDALCVAYYRSPEFLGLADSTQQQRRNILDNFRAAHGGKPLKDLHRKHMKDILGAKANTPEAANHLLKVLRGILAFAVDQSLIPTNPAAGVKKYRSKSDGHHSWSEVEIAQFQQRHPIGTKAGLALALGLYTGQRKGDCLRMDWQHVTGDSIAVRQEKTKTPLVLELHPVLKAALASVPRTNLTFLVTEWGAPFTSAGFGNWFRDQCNAAGLRHCSFHGLRKACATQMAEANCTAEQIKAVTGHRSLREVEKYTRAADQKRLAAQALANRLRAEGEQNLSNLVPRLDKTGSK